MSNLIELTDEKPQNSNFKKKLSKAWLKTFFTCLILSLLPFQNSLYANHNAIGDINHAKESSTQSSISQQSRKVTGHIWDAAGESMIGVAIVVKGTTSGSITDFNGAFTIDVPEGYEEIEISYVGYKSQTINISNQNNLSIVLEEDTQIMDEVVVTALGIKRSQKALSYNAQEIKGDEITGVKDVNFMNSLSGKVAGVNINASSAGVGGATRVVMRGAKSITKDNNALYVIDGVPIFNPNNGDLSQNNEYADQPRGEGISDLNPEDIESMTVLTGAAAAALYGSNAANGAIIIVTKKGAVGKPKVIVSNQTTFSNPFVLYKFQNKYGNRTGEYRSWGNIQNKYNYNPKDFFDTGAVTQTSASLSVGSEKNQTYLSLGMTDGKGIIPTNEYNKYNVTLRNTTSFLNDKMTLDFGFSYIKQEDQNMMAQGRYFNPLVGIYTYSRGENPQDMINYEIYDHIKGYNVQQWNDDLGLNAQNPYWILNRNKTNNKKDRYMMNVNLQYDILNWLNVTGRVRLDNSVNEYTHKLHASTITLFSPEYGRYKATTEQDKQIYADLLFNINKYWNDYSFTANVGTSISDMRSIEKGADGGLIVPNYFALTNIDKKDPKMRLIHTGWHEQTQSVFANLELGWKSMVYLTVTGRNDWSSALANTLHDSFFYPSVGLSGVISEMVKMPEFISYLKVRGSYSSVGSAIPRNLSIPTYEFDDQAGVWKTITDRPMKEIKPERTGSWEVGLSSKFWGNRLGLEATWYKSNTKNQLYKIGSTSGSEFDNIYVQSGNVQNQGLELTLSSHNRFGAFSWNSAFTASYNKNKIVELIKEGEVDDYGELIELEAMSNGGIGSVEFRFVEGGTIGDLWTKTTLKREDDGSLSINDGAPSVVDKYEKAGSVLPKWNLGFRNDFEWKNFTAGFLVSARLGGIVVSPTQAILDGFGVTEATAKARDNGGVFVEGIRFDAEKYYREVGRDNGLLSDYIYNATNVRLQEVSFGYNLPSKWFNNVMKMNVSFVGRNLWMIYNKAPFDPESTASTGTYFQGIDYFMQPSQRNLGFSVRMEF